MKKETQDWDPVVAQIKMLFDARYHRRPQDRSMDSPSDEYRRRWKRYFPAADGINLRRADSAEAVRCSAATYERGLEFLNRVCLKAKTMGFTVEMGSLCAAIKLTRDASSVHIRLLEQLQRHPTSKSKDEKPFHTWLFATGVLELHVAQDNASISTLRDDGRGALETKLDMIADAIERRHRGSVDFNKKMADARERSRKEQEQKARAEAKIKADLEFRKSVIAEAEEWKRSQAVREYVAALDHSIAAGGHARDGYAEWRVAALAIADSLDPSKNHIDAEGEQG